MFSLEFKQKFFAILEELMFIFPNDCLINLAMTWRKDGKFDKFANYCSYLIEANPGKGIGTIPIALLPTIPLKI